MPTHTAATKATIWLSRSWQCIYRNLALEDWIFRRNSFADQDGLLIWRNRPAVVIGRHQNPWVEANIDYARKHRIDVARRQSGGGTVYHDLGNVNICIFTNKARHKRDDNMRFLAKILKDGWGVNAEVSKRHDLYLDGKYKISGTAAKLTHDKAYHHFTLMLAVDLGHLWNVLSPSVDGISSKATASTRSEVKTLVDVKTGITYDAIVEAIVDEFRSQYKASELFEIDSITNDQFENIEDTFNEFSSWRWIYGNTPPFTISAPFGVESTATVSVQIEKGAIARFVVDKSDRGTDQSLEEILNTSAYIGCRFEPDVWKGIADWLRP